MAEVNLKSIQGVQPASRPVERTGTPAVPAKRVDGFTLAQAPAASSPTFRQLGASPAARYAAPTSSAAWDQVCGMVGSSDDLATIRSTVVSDLEAQLREVV